jgi:hypothetical protein
MSIIFRQMVCQRLQCGFCSTAMILGQGYKGPCHGGRFEPGPIIDILPAKQDLLIPGKRPVDFPVANPNFIGTREVVDIRNIGINSFGPQVLVEIGGLSPLFPL